MKGPPDEHLGDVQDAVQFAAMVEDEPAWREGLERVARLACELLDVPVAQVNVVLPDRQRSLVSVGDGEGHEEWSGPRDVPLEGTYCRYVVQSGEPLEIHDAETNPRVKDNPATTEGGVRAYLAIPLKNAAGKTLATLCVVDFRPRDWAPASTATLRSLAELLMREIRSRVRAERELERGEARFRALIEQGGDLITILGPEGTIRYQSPAYERILGYPEEGLLDRPFAELVHPADRARWSDRFMAALKEPGSRARDEWRMAHRDGSWRTMKVKGANLLHDRAVRGIVLNMLDVSKEKRIQLELQQAQKMEAVGRLAGGVAHDFNNLLTAIEGNTTFLLERGDLSAEAEEDVREMLDAAERAGGLTRQLLSFSRDQVLEVKVRDLGVVAKNILPLLKRLLGTNVTLKTDLREDLPIEADEGQLGQVIMNLAVNARDAMPGGGILRLETRLAEVTQEQAGSHGAIHPGRYAQLVVADNGQGMSRQVQEKVFEPFFTTKARGQGTGLGLSLSWGVVRQMDGHIHLYSEPGKGTTFRLYFPWAEGVADEDDDGPSVGETPALPVSPGRILVVEDQPEVERIMTRVLEADGHEVITAESGELALDAAATLAPPPDLLLSDVLLPGMTGPEVAWRLREKWPHLALIFTSGFTRGELLNQDVDLGEAAFLPKPFGPRELSEAVADVLRDAPSRLKGGQEVGCSKEEEPRSMTGVPSSQVPG